MHRTWYGAGVIAGILVFLWGGLAHMVLGLGGDSTFQQIPDQQTVMSTLASKIKDPGLYVYPFEKDMAKLEPLLAANPYGILIYAPPGASMDMGPRMAKQVLGDIFACLLLAWLLQLALPSLPTLRDRVGFCVVAGLFGFLLTEVPYWNWYRFPLDFTAFALVFRITLCLLAGAVLGSLLGSGRSPSNQ